MIKFDTHSVIVHALSSTTDTSFNTEGHSQSTIFNLRVALLADSPSTGEIRMVKEHVMDMRRRALYDDALRAADSGLFLLRKNPGREHRFEGTLVLESVSVSESVDHMPILTMDKLGQFRIDSTIKHDTVELIKKIAADQIKSGFDIRAKDRNTAWTDHHVRFGLTRSSIKEAFLLRITNLKK